MRSTPTSRAKAVSRVVLALSCAALFSTSACHREQRRPSTAESPLPDLEAVLIEPVESRGAFERIRDEFMSIGTSGGKFDLLPDLADRDEASALGAMRTWLRHEFGEAIDDVELVPVQFKPFTSRHADGFMSIQQVYRGIETPGFALYTVSPNGITACVSLHRLHPKSGTPSPIISADAASDAADAELRETPNALSRRREGDFPALQYNASEDLGKSHWDLVWMFRLPNGRFGSPPIVNARTGKVTIYICGTGLPDSDFSPERK